MHRARRAPAGIRADPVRPPIGDQLDVAVEIGAEHGNARSGGECRQGLGRGMPVLVALAGGDDCHGRIVASRNPGVLDEVEPWCPTFSTSTAGSSRAINQRRLDRRLGVAGQQGRESAEPDDHGPPIRY